jgi:hypothetical protein
MTLAWARDDSSENDERNDIIDAVEPADATAKAE